MSQVKKFFGILKLELFDLQEDLEFLIGLEEKKFASGEISEYVLKNNSALYHHELNALQDFVKELDAECCGEYESPEDAISHIQTVLPEKVKDWNYPQGIVMLVRRKMEKINSFLSSENLV